MPLYHKKSSQLIHAFNALVMQGFYRFNNQQNIRKTHEFNGRYENIYLDDKHIPELKALIDEALTFAEDISGASNLRAGYWFNHMPPGATTTLHTHDDFDELLSAVYYVHVPENSGNLIIYDGSEKIEINSKTGDFIFFKPDVRHEVSKNNSNEHRLSIGINFGIDKD